MNNKILQIGIILILIYPGTLIASSEWKINKYDTKMEINSDSSVNVEELIEFDFGQDAGHGIYRKIPYRYNARGGLFTYKYLDFKVRDENSNNYSFTRQNDWTNLNIKIGDEDKQILGVHTYIISYKIKRAINYFGDHDELYWNAVGTEWDNPIQKASAKVYLPKAISKSETKSTCYSGKEGSAELCQNTPELIISGDKVIGYSYEAQDLSPGEALTIVSNIPKGIIYEPNIGEYFLEVVKDNWIVVFPFITFILMFKLWLKKGKDPKGKGTIIAQFDSPDNLSPAEVGAVIDSSVSNKDISSEIIQLAIMGYFKINRIEEKKFLGKSVDYQLDKLKEPDSKLNSFQSKLFKALFTKREKETVGQLLVGLKDMLKKKETFTPKGLVYFGKNQDLIEEDYSVKGSLSFVKLSDLKDQFYIDFQSIVSEVYNSVVSKNYFPKNPVITKVLWVAFGVVVVCIGFVFGIVGPIWLMSVVISGMIIIIFGFFMSKVTEKGALTKEYILGLKEYLKIAESEKIKFHNAPEKNPQLFEKLLPFAMVLGVEKEWAKQFEGIYNQNPGWYGDSTGASFNSMLFVSSMKSFSDITTQTLSSAPGGGSGFSGGAGGGGGGGGGGGW